MYSEIYVKGCLPTDWADWFGGLKITDLGNGDSRLAGELVDQTALLGVLNHLHSLHLTLLALTTSHELQAQPAGEDAER